jgi:hypothetical protein
MIKSPCFNCQNKHIPKCKCLKNCIKIKEVQDYLLIKQQEELTTGIDPIEEDHSVSF